MSNYEQSWNKSKTQKAQERTKRYKEEPYGDVRTEKQNNLKKKLGGYGLSCRMEKREETISVLKDCNTRNYSM